MTQRILDSLTYGCYKTNRELTPHVKPEDWQPCFDAPVGPMEARYQAELGQRMNDMLERMHRNQVADEHNAKVTPRNIRAECEVGLWCKRCRCFAVDCLAFEVHAMARQHVSGAR